MEISMEEFNKNFYKYVSLIEKGTEKEIIIKNERHSFKLLPSADDKK